MTPQVLSASTLDGDPVVNRDGEEVGHLKEIMIDLNTGGVAYAVLRRGGVMGMGEKLFAVPWSLLTVDGDRKRLEMDIDPDVLEESPGFDPDNWPQFDEKWATDVHRHFGVEPYWRDREAPPVP